MRRFYAKFLETGLVLEDPFMTAYVISEGYKIDEGELEKIKIPHYYYDKIPARITCILNDSEVRMCGEKLLM